MTGKNCAVFRKKTYSTQNGQNFCHEIKKSHTRFATGVKILQWIILDKRKKKLMIQKSIKISKEREFEDLKISDIIPGVVVNNS